MPDEPSSLRKKSQPIVKQRKFLRPKTDYRKGRPLSKGSDDLKQSSFRMQKVVEKTKPSEKESNPSLTSDDK